MAWRVVEPSTPYIHGWHVDAICEHLEAVTRGEIRDLLINMPPRHMKSLLVSVFWPVWEWITFPERRWLFSSYALQLAIRDSLKSRRLIESPFFRRRWGDRFELSSDQNVKSRYDNTMTGYRYSTSVDSAATGEGGDRIVVDDPHSVRDADSDIMREATITWWRETMSTRGNNPKTVARVIVMQRVHERDLSGYALEEGGWEHLCLPAEYDGKRKATSIGWVDPRKESHELLWPDRFGRDEIDRLKHTLGSQASAGQLQQEPAPAGGAIFKAWWLRFWYPHDVAPPRPYTVKLEDGTAFECPQVALPVRFDMQAQSWDLAFKGKDVSDFVCGQVWARQGSSCFLLAQTYRQMGFIDSLAAIRQMSADWPQTAAKWIEDKANGPAVIETLKSSIPGLIAIEPKGGKVERARAAEPLLEAGNVFLPHPALNPWVNDLISNILKFPRAAHDDDVDAMTQALIRLQQDQVQIFDITAMSSTGQRRNPFAQ